MTTIKEIAELAGVSRGTVDRVLNNRGSVNPQTAKKIMDIVRTLDYRPNKAGLALAAQKKKYKIGVLLFSEYNPFFDEIMKGVQDTALELANYGFTTITKRVDFDASAQLNAIDEFLEEGIHGLILAPYNHISIIQKIDQLIKQEIPVLTINTDIEGSSRLAYVGSDYYRGGCIAAGLFGLTAPETVHLGIISGSSNVLCHTERIRGLTDTIQKNYPQIQVAAILENHDDEFESFTLTQALLEEHPEINAVFFAAAGVYGGCNAILKSSRHPTVITFDDVPTTVAMLKNNVISATISQQPRKQGSQALNLLFEYFTSGHLPEQEKYFVDHSILIREML